MNKSKLIEALAQKSEVSKVDAEKVFNALIETIISNVQDGVKVTLAGLGTFEKVERAARMGINPMTKEKIQIKAKNAPKFKAAKTFKEKIA